jgi:hypothetical protein
VYISKEDVFKQALQYPLLQQRKFFGDYKLIEKDALELEILAALVYLQKVVPLQHLLL